MLESILFMLEATGEQIRQYYQKVPDDVYDTGLTSFKSRNFKGAGLIEASNNKLTSFKYLPTDNYKIYVDNNKITSLKGLNMSVESEMQLSMENNSLTNLNYFFKLTSANFEVEGHPNFNFKNNKITSLKGLPKDFKNFSLDISKNPLKEIDDLPKNIGELWIDKKWQGKFDESGIKFIKYV
jgi:hypothetical protein